MLVDVEAVFFLQRKAHLQSLKRNKNCDIYYTGLKHTLSLVLHVVCS